MIVVFNDGKERHQSFEAVFSDKDEQGQLLLPGLAGYGADEAEAAVNLIQQLKALQAALEQVSTEIADRQMGRPSFGRY